jgi:hypothetical protein
VPSAGAGALPQTPRRFVPSSWTYARLAGGAWVMVHSSASLLWLPHSLPHRLARAYRTAACRQGRSGPLCSPSLPMTAARARAVAGSRAWWSSPRHPGGLDG